MISRRRFLQHALLASSLPLAIQRSLAQTASSFTAPPLLAQTKCTQHVDVFIGTGGHGHTFPGATVPFGMVQLSPDTYNAIWDSSSGYHGGDGSIMGFSHTHLSGTGVGDMLDVLVMPGVGSVQTKPGDPTPAIQLYHSRFDAVHENAAAPRTAPVYGHTPGYRAAFTRADEMAEPGYYRVHLRDRQVTAELTATRRVGLHRYTFPASAHSHLLVDLQHGMQDNPDVPTRIIDSQLKIVGNDTLLGGRRVDEWASGRHIYFAMQVSRPFTRHQLFTAEQPQGSDATQAQSKSIQCALHFDTHAGETIVVKVGISAVSPEGALRNLDSELPGWDFDTTRQAALQAWERELSKIQVQLADERHRRMFYTAMYHSLIVPTLFSDVDGQYRGMDLAIHQLPQGAENYTEFSLWDIYRAEMPLLTLIQPERVPDLANSLIRMAEQSPAGVPVWPLQGHETGCMIGYHSAVVLAEAQAKKFDGIDFAKAWPLWRKRAMDDAYEGLDLYRQQGYVPADKEAESASKTLEYAYDDWAMAQLAKTAGADDDHQRLLARSRNYQHVFDPADNFVKPRLADGQWAAPFDPRAMGHSSQWRDFTESNAWQATFLNQHDIYHYMAMFGSEQAFVDKLDQLFSISSQLPADAPPDIAGMVGQYAHGNEPSHHVSYLYAYAGQPWKTQARVRSLLETMYDDKPDGEAGNDDCGQISAWLILSALGFYPVDPVSGDYVFGSPQVSRALITLQGGRQLLIEAHGNNSRNVYVQSVRLNGRVYPHNWISHATLVQGGHLEFEMGAQPNHAFGSDPAHRPPSFGQTAV